MDIKAYISSGIIEAYVMGVASEEEVRILDCIQKNNPEVRQAIAEAQETLEDFASKQAITPPEDLKSKIWAKISEASISSERAANTPTIPLHTASPSGANQPNWQLRKLSIAASLLLFVSIAFNVYYYQNHKGAEAQLVKLTATQKNTELAYLHLQRKWDLTNSPAITKIPLVGVAGRPGMKALVYHEKGTNAVYVSLENLPAPPQDMQYQLWAIVAGKPVSLGVYNQDGVQKMAAVTAAQAFAISLEKRGGVATPTMENIYVMGKI